MTASRSPSGLGSPAHLFKRFFDVVSAQPLEPSEQAFVEDWLTPPAQDVFFAQSDADQRHGFHAASTVIEAGVKDREVVVAALLHDVGKRHARLGVIGRSLASILILSGLPLGERMRSYRDHGLLGARELAGLSLPSLVVDFAMHHHGSRPATIDQPTWDVLVAADQPSKPRKGLVRRIISADT